jgi:hypothetical protein
MPDRHAQAHLSGRPGPSSRRRDPRGATGSFMTSELNDRRAVSRARRVAARLAATREGAIGQRTGRDRRDVTMILAAGVLAFIAEGMFALAVTGWPA